MSGRGFARRVTAENLIEFYPVLRWSQENAKDSSTRKKNAKTSDRDALFPGEPITTQRPFTKRKRQRASRGVSARVRMIASIPLTSVSMLFAELPRNGDRLSQAGFDKQTWIQYFGADQTAPIIFRQVATDGLVRGAEVRPGVVVASKNYRLELKAASKLRYPVGGPPIAVFLPIAQREYLYMLLLPSDENYSYAKRIMDGIGARGRAMRRFPVDVPTARAEWPDSPLLAAGLKEDT